MNFFQAQDDARRKSVWLILLFVLATVSMILFANLIALAALACYKTGQLPLSAAALSLQFDWKTFTEVAIAVAAIVAGGSIYKTLQLSEGGRVIAEFMGGIPVNRNSTNPMDRKILNVVEEMAIAASLPVPSVYLLENEPGINAFAAGWTPGSAVIGITKGAVEILSRDELQGVIAHEFSHILNGDMRFNIRLTGILEGILLLGIIGHYVLPRYHSHGSRNSRSGRTDLALWILGIGLIVIGWVGSFLGNLIKAMVSRQREYLADASAVQFTRNKDGIAGALKKIGGLNFGSRLMTSSAREYSHAFFAKGLGRFTERFQTHPPLKARIRRIDPSWNGRFIQPGSAPYTPERYDLPKPAASVDIGAGAGFIGAVQAIDRIGQPSEEQVSHARDLLSTLPEALKREAQDPYGVRALMYGLVIHSDPAVREVQWQLIEGHEDKGLCQKTGQLSESVATLDRKFRLPLIDLATPALSELTATHYQSFKRTLLALMGADNKIDLGEWVIQRVLLQRLDETHGLRKRPAARFSVLGDVKGECELLLSLIAYAEHGADEAAAAQAFDAAKKAAGATALTIVPRKSLSLRLVNEAVEKLAQLKPLLKPRLLKACVACAGSGNHLGASANELIRAVAVSLDCPMPMLLNG